ncbi:MAG TPA: hypothetical protein VF950_00355 [Planctomycetota bacterium]
MALCLVPLSACLKDDSGSSTSQTGLGAATPILWQDQSTASGGNTGDTPLSDLYIDSTTVTATGAGAIIPSIDEITYSFPKIPPYIAGNNHQLMVNSAAAAVVNPEDQLLTRINNYRLQTLGAAAVGGAGGGAGGNIGVPIGGIIVTAIPPSGKLRKNARAHCKHHGKLSNNHPGALPAVNAEGDDINSGGVTPQGRLRKGLIQVTSVAQGNLSGPAYSTAQLTFDYLVSVNALILTTTAYTYIGIGHWPQGDQQFYWSFIAANGVNPVN